MMIREPIASGRAYSRDAADCLAELARLFSHIDNQGSLAGLGKSQKLGGLLPCSAWSISGAVSATVIDALLASGINCPDAIVLFSGTAHYTGRKAALFVSGRWQTPLGVVSVDDRLAERVLGHTNLIADDPYAHEMDPSIEVQLPFIQYLSPGSKILPIIVPAVSNAHEIGEAIARTVEAYSYRVLVMGAADLVVHPTPPHSKTTRHDDQDLVDLVLQMRSTEIVAAAAHRPISAGAIAATVRAVMALGATRADLVVNDQHPQADPGMAENESLPLPRHVGAVFG
jgi:AmmeMemoRadiSam system protein B